MRPPQFNYNFNEEGEGWFLESIRTDGICIELIMKHFVSRRVTEENIDKDIQNRSQGRRRQFKTQNRLDNESE